MRHNQCPTAESAKPLVRTDALNQVHTMEKEKKQPKRHKSRSRRPRRSRDKPYRERYDVLDKHFGPEPPEHGDWPGSRDEDDKATRKYWKAVGCPRPDQCSEQTWN